MRLVLATANPHKAAEVSALLAGQFEVAPRPESVGEVDETEDTLEGNARLKAHAVMVATGEVAVADDTGLEVDALDGRPGVYSARYAGAAATYGDNVTKLLAELAAAAAAAGTTGAGSGGVNTEVRTARFRTVALAAFPDGTEIVAEGVVEGEILAEARGHEGFGYDPVFVPDEGDGRTFAEMSQDEKSELSHRGRAFRSLATGIVAFTSGPR